MPPSQDAQTNASASTIVSVDVGRTFTDIVTCDGSGFSIRKIASAPSDRFENERTSGAAAKVLRASPGDGVLAAAQFAKAAGYSNVITFEVGGTSTRAAVVVEGSTQWSTETVVDAPPRSLPVFNIHTIDAGGGSVAFLDATGTLSVGPRSAGAIPGPACYAKGGVEATVTDANVVLGRILPNRVLGGSININVHRANDAIQSIAANIGKTPIATALDILRIAEANMADALRAITSQRGHDPRDFALICFGGAGGLHACALAESLSIPRVLIPPDAGVLSAMGALIASPIADASEIVLQLGAALDDERLPAEVGRLSGRTIDVIPFERTTAVEVYVDARFRGQSNEVRCRIHRPSIEHIREQFLAAYQKLYGPPRSDGDIEIVTLRVRRFGKALLAAPSLLRSDDKRVEDVTLSDSAGIERDAKALSRFVLLQTGTQPGPLLLIDAEATSYIPAGWSATAREDGCIMVERL